MIDTSGCSSLHGNMLPEMASFVFPPLCHFIYHRWYKERYSCIVSRKGRDHDIYSAEGPYENNFRTFDGAGEHAR